MSSEVATGRRGDGAPVSEFVSSLRDLREAFPDRSCEGAEILLVDIPLHADAGELVPSWMRLGARPLGTLLLARYDRPTYTAPYRLAGLFMHVSTPAGRGVHPCWMVGTEATATIYGHELVGFPKKDGDVRVSREGDRLTASLESKGRCVLSLEAALGGPAPPEPVFDQKMFCIGGPGTAHLVSTVWLMRVCEEKKSVRHARVQIEYGDAPPDPLRGLIAGEPIRSRLVTCDVMGLRYLLPIGLAGPRGFVPTFGARAR
jgi:acetoacetate decarboxylase